MKFLFLPLLHSVYDIPWGLTELGHSVSILEDIVFDPSYENPIHNELLSQELSSAPPDYVISPCFIPAAADICSRFHIPYISWVYDSPQMSLFTESVHYPTNYIFIFDREQYLRLKNLDVPHVYHIPLAANISRIGMLDITDEDETIYSHSISFVGNLYEDNKYNELIQTFPTNIQDEFKLYLMQNLCNWKTTRPWPKPSAKAFCFMKEVLKAEPHLLSPLLEEDIYLGILILSRKLAEMERITVLNTLANSFPVDLYTRSNSAFLEKITLHRGVDYYTVMNKIFYFSKINLNITLPSIETGVPQRIFDIMACGGFVLTNYQEELSDLFEIGKEIEVYHDLNELIEKCHYYLTHEKERLTIAINGYKKVRDSFSYPHQLQRILDIVKENSV